MFCVHDDILDKHGGILFQVNFYRIILSVWRLYRIVQDAEN